MPNISNQYTGAELFVDALEEYNVRYLFGNPGTTELPLMNALSNSDIEYVLGTHEDIAVGAAAGYGSTSRYLANRDESVNPLGVVNLHVAPGVAHGLGNLYGAMWAASPVLVTAGNYETNFQHHEPVLGGDLERMTRQFTKWSAEVKDIIALPTMLRRAVRTALSPPAGPVFLGLPLNVFVSETEASVEPLGPIPKLGPGHEGDLDMAEELLVEASEPIVILGDWVGRGGRASVDSAARLAETVGARVYDEAVATEVNLQYEHPNRIARLPGDGDAMAAHLVGDVLVFIGCSSQTTSLYYENGVIPSDASVIHIGPDAWELGKNEPVDASILGDPRRIMDDLADAITSRLSDVSREERASEVTRWIEENHPDEPLEPDPEGMITKHELGRALHDATDEVLIVYEGITSGVALRTEMDLDAEEMIGNKSGGLGYGLPAAVGAALAEQQRDQPRKVVAFIGDGSYLYYPHTVYSAVRHNLDLTVVIPNNRNYQILKMNMTKILGGSKEDYDYVGMDFDPPVDIPGTAKSYGASGYEVSDPNDLASTLGVAIAEPEPSVVSVIVTDRQ